MLHLECSVERRSRSPEARVTKSRTSSNLSLIHPLFCNQKGTSSHIRIEIKEHPYNHLVFIRVSPRGSLAPHLRVVVTLPIGVPSEQLNPVAAKLQGVALPTSSLSVDIGSALRTLTTSGIDHGALILLDES
jgi:hypothetical protein